MKKMNLVKGCAIVMMVCMTGCGMVTKDRTPKPEVNIPPAATYVPTTESSSQPPLENPQTEMPESEPPVSENTDNSQLSDDLYSYQIIINGDFYQLPMDFADLTANGWQMKQDENEELGAYTLYPNVTFKNGDYDMEASIINLSDKPQPYSACTIVALDIKQAYNGKNHLDFILPKGIQSDKSTIEEVKKAYGEPTNEYGDSSIFLTYEQNYAQNEIKLTFDDGILADVSIKNEEY